MGEQGHVEQLGFAVAFQRAGDLRHLHQAEHPLLHPGTAGGTDDQQGQLAGGGLLDQTGDFLSPTTEPIDPPMKRKSIAARPMGMPSTRQSPVTTPSRSPVEA